MKSVSIAMATYNGARYIREQLESLAQQTVLPGELVITDDCSSDTTLKIIADFATRAPFPVRVTPNEQRLGYRGNFMKVAGLCRSELIAFSDQDDVWKPGKLKACLETFNNKDVLLTYHNATVVTETLEPVGFMDYSAPSQTISPPMSLAPWKNAAWGFTVVIDRFLLEFQDLWPQSVDVYESDEKDKHDQWFFFLASCLGSIAYVNESLALYRQHGKNSVGYQGAPTLRGKLEILLANDMDGITGRQISAEHRALILERAQEKLDGRYRARARQAADGYRKLGVIYRTRREMYASGNIFSRSRRLLSLSRSGGYRPRPQWGVGRGALLRDIVRGVFFPSRKHYKETPASAAMREPRGN